MLLLESNPNGADVKITLGELRVLRACMFNTEKVIILERKMYQCRV